MAEENSFRLGGEPRNLRTDAHVELKQANIEYTKCVNTDFLPQWLKGAALNINEVCGSQYESMMEKNAEVYGESPIPFRTFTLPQ